ncbi:MAG: hypothetical protein JHC87_00820 [Thermoleophilaceae bacterium]|nr:hypothetical protein [Thermoleophilaceae bacterium]
MTVGLLEPRLYRAAFIPALFALVLMMFSLEPQPRPVAPSLQPPAFSGIRVANAAATLQERYGARQEGSSQDAAAAGFVKRQLLANDFTAHSYATTARTVDGRRALTNVVGVRPGLTDRRLVVVASRDGLRGNFEAVGAYETAALLEMSRVIEGRSLRHTVVLASTDGGVSGGAGAAELAHQLKGPIDAVFVLRNLPAAKTIGRPVLADTNRRLVPATGLIRSVDAAYRAELRRSTGQRSLPAQLVRMGFPLALGEQAAIAEGGLGAVALSPAGEPLVVPGSQAAASAGSSGRALLRTMIALDARNTSNPLQRPVVKLGDKQIPSLPLVLLIAALTLPLLVIAVDSWARARRRRELSARGVAAPLVALVPLLAVLLALRALGVVGAIDAPAFAPDPAAYTGGFVLVLGVIFCLLAVFGIFAVGRLSAHAANAGGEAGLALWLAFFTLAAFALNPVATAFALPLIHVTMLMLLSDENPRTLQVVPLVTVAATPLIFALLYFPIALQMGPPQSIWFATTLLAGGFISPVALLVEAAILAGVTAAVGMVLGRSGGTGSESRAVDLGPAFKHAR